MVPNSAYQQAILNLGPWLYCPMDDHPSSPFHDISGHNRNLAFVPANYTLNVTGLIPTSSDSAAYSSHHNNVLLSQPVTFPTCTLICWISTISSAAVLDVWRINSPGGFIYAHFDIRGGQVNLNMDSPANTDHIVTGGPELRDGRAHMIVGSYDGATLKVYVDGAVVGTLAIVFTPLTGTRDLGLGNDQNFYSGTAFDGIMDEATIFDYALTDQQIADLYALATTA